MKTPAELVDQYLGELTDIETDIDQVKFVMGKKIKTITELYHDSLARLEERKGFLEKMVGNLVKKHRPAILGDKDRADLVNGAVMLKEEKRVRRIRKMLANLKAQGLDAGVKKTEAVDWDAVEKFKDDVLAKLGTERVPKLIFSYELKRAKAMGNGP